MLLPVIKTTDTTTLTTAYMTTLTTATAYMTTLTTAMQGLRHDNKAAAGRPGAQLPK